MKRNKEQSCSTRNNLFVATEMTIIKMAGTGVSTAVQMPASHIQELGLNFWFLVLTLASG